MEKLNEYLQTLLSTSSYELHLEPNKNPYLVSSEGNMDITNTPLLGTQISMMVFPLIPTNVKQQLPTQPQIEFVHPHNLGDFNITVKKSPAGFNVTIRPVINGEEIQAQFEKDLAEEDNLASPNLNNTNFENTEMLDISAKEVKIEEPQEPFYATPEIIPDEVQTPNQQLNSYSKLETTSVDDLSFATSFSDDSAYEPPLKKSEFAAMPEIVSEQIFKTNFETETEIVETDSNDWSSTYNNSPDFAVETYYPQTDFEQIDQKSQIPAIEQIQPPIQPKYAPPLQEQTANPQARMDALFRKMASVGSSDLHLSVSAPPMIRKDGKMAKLDCAEGVLTAEVMRELLTSIMPPKIRKNLRSGTIRILLTKFRVWRVFGQIFLWTEKEWAAFSVSFRLRF